MKSLGQMAEYIKIVIGITDRDLATNLGITIKTLNSWRELMEFEAFGKAERLKMFYAVVKYLELQRKRNIYSFICNARIKTFEPDRGDSDLDDGTISVISYIQQFPKDVNWMEKIDRAIED